MRLVDLVLLGFAAALPATELRAQSLPIAPDERPALRASILPASLPNLLREPQDRIRIEAVARLAADGQLYGEAVVEAQGNAALLLGQFLTSIRDIPLERLSATMMSRQLLDGQLLQLDPSLETTSGRQSVAMRYRFAPSITRDGRNGLPLSPGPRLVRGAYVNLVSQLRERRPGDVACPFQSVEHSISIALPETLGPLVLPPDIAIQLGATSYHARYARVGTQLVILRRLVLDAGSQVCSSAKLREVAPVIHAAAHDMARRLAID